MTIFGHNLLNYSTVDSKGNLTQNISCLRSVNHRRVDTHIQANVKARRGIAVNGRDIIPLTKVKQDLE
jgi:hypothetical protein